MDNTDHHLYYPPAGLDILASVRREGDDQRRRRRESAPFREFLAGVGRRVAFVRVGRGLTQQKAAADAGLDLSLWQRIEAGEANSTMLVFHDIARALGVEVRQIVTPRVADRDAGPRKAGRPRARGPR